MAKPARAPMPKKWIILVTVVIVVIIVGVLLVSYKPPQLSMTVKSIKALPNGNFNLTLTYTTKDLNITSGEYRVKIVARRTLETTEEKKDLTESPLPNVPPQSSVDQSFVLDAKGYTDLSIYVLKGSKQVLFQTQRIPIV